MDSPFSNLFKSNYVPTHYEEVIIKGIVASQETVLKDLDERIQALTHKRDRHAKFKDEHRASISPMRKLPADVLSCIFLSYLDQCLWLSSYRPRQHPSVRLTHICQRWREVALATPLLWNTIRIKCPSSPYAFFDTCPQSLQDHLAHAWNLALQNEEEMFNMCLERSGNCPLKLTVVVSDIFPITNATRMNPAIYLRVDEVARWRIIRAICDTSPRWESITLDIRASTLDSPILQLLQVEPERVPNLRTIQFSSPSTPFDQDESCGSSFTLLGAEGLHTLRWGQLLSVPMASSIPVHWQALTELYFGDSGGSQIGQRKQMSFTDAFVILEKCPNLARCTLTLHTGAEDSDHVWFGPLGAAVPLEPFALERKAVLLQLQNLHLRTTAVPPGFASALVLPSLHTLSIYCKRYRSGVLDDVGTVEFTQMFGDQLQDVAFNIAALSRDGLASCLQSLRAVTRLRFTHGYDYLDAPFMAPGGSKAIIDANVLSGFHPQFDQNGGLMGGCYCPKLERFFCNLAGQETTEASVMQFVNARRSIPEKYRHEIVRIKEVGMRFDLSETLDIPNALQEAGVDMEGCVLKIQYRNRGKETERQISYTTYNPRDLYGDVCRDEFEEDPVDDL